jgi:hypothetical protein
MCGTRSVGLVWKQVEWKYSCISRQFKIYEEFIVAKQLLVRDDTTNFK